MTRTILPFRYVKPNSDLSMLGMPNIGKFGDAFKRRK
jgi:hypothetical protein